MSDGSGYPSGLTGDQILGESKIVAVADVVESMTFHRPYRAALGIEMALQEITKYRGILYDADSVDACVKLIREKKFQILKLIISRFQYVTNKIALTYQTAFPILRLH